MNGYLKYKAKGTCITFEQVPFYNLFLFHRCRLPLNSRVYLHFIDTLSLIPYNKSAKGT